MKTINHECYVSLEVAKLLKDAGFDWKCINRYIKDTDLLVPCLGETNWNAAEWGINDYKSAPTLDVAQRWLRETQKYHVEVSCAEEKGYLPIYFLYKTNITQNFVFYPTYEEALEAGIKKALEMILKKGE